MAKMVVLGSLGTSLVELLVGEVDFSVENGFDTSLEVNFGARECEGFWGRQGR